MPGGGHRYGSGSKPTPRELVLARGNPGKRAIPAETVKPVPLEGVVDCPASLSADPIAVEFWDTYAPIHRRMGTLTAASLPNFTMLCQAWGVFWRPAVKDRPRNEAFSRWRFLSVEFGIGPASLMRLNVLAAEKAKDPVEEFRAQRKTA